MVHKPCQLDSAGCDALQPPMSQTFVQADLVDAVDAAGFAGQVVSTADVQQVDQQLLLHISGMTCSSCSTAVEKALQATPGVRSAAVSLVQSRAEVRPCLCRPSLVAGRRDSVCVCVCVCVCVWVWREREIEKCCKAFSEMKLAVNSIPSQNGR